ncbi:MAG TPA: 23S rRNA (adenine(2503)-C(2))-methyltransferase RlmN [Solirubrobacteraceae bacterium]|jgi:23S rRNA (adenine2503-C2)-methyltransferase|nr:23S rRNA (adenine(2503)-C(2))-methyltransferase RlmN [Solirubrobacteraceae bacterium]
MDLKLLERALVERGQPPFRARQVWAWAAHGASSYEQMTDLPSSLRAELQRELPFSSVSLAAERSASDGTVKALFHTADGHPLETVLMRYPPPRGGRGDRGGGGGRGGGAGRASHGGHTGRASGRAPATGGPRWSLCLSSQSGCPLTCSFCATGAMRFARNLSASEILDQALHFLRRGKLGRARASHCVFMGMGEPMLNLDSVLAACERLPDLGIAHRHTAISTVGWIPGIERLARQPMPLRLALSLHAAEDALRSQLMPVNDRYPLADVIDAACEFFARKRRRVFVEYVMLAGVNDRYEQAVALAGALARHDEREQPIFKVNLIPYNPTPSAAGYRCSSPEAIAAFRAPLRERGIPVTVRLVRGREIDAACGQLAARAGAP